MLNIESLCSHKTHTCQSEAKKESPTVVLLDLSQCQVFLLVVAWQVLYVGGRRYELNCILLADDLANILCLEILLADVAGLIIEQTMGVTQPCHSSEKDPNTKNSDR